MICADPANFDRTTAFVAAVVECRQFLALNAIDEPRFFVDDLDSYGLYVSPDTVYVNVRKTSKPVKKPGFRWSFTGYKADLTVYGVTAHETGHHVHVKLRRSRVNDLIYSLQVDKEPPVSSYEPNMSELFAEAMKLFILNPDLLRQGRPRRYALFTRTLGLKPLHTAPAAVLKQHEHRRTCGTVGKESSTRSSLGVWRWQRRVWVPN